MQTRLEHQKQIKVSVIIVNWNTRDLLRACLASLHQDPNIKHIEIVVVDNASDDDSVGMVRSEFPKVSIIENKSNIGYARAANQALKITCAPYCLLMNSDILVLNGAIWRLLEFMECDPSIGITGGRVLNPDKSLQQSCLQYPSILNILLWGTGLSRVFRHSRFFGREDMTWWKADQPCEVEAVKGCFFLIRKEAMNKVGLMDEDYFLYSEETDWCYRFKKSGYKVMFTPKAEVIHYDGASTRQVPLRSRFLFHKSKLMFFRKRKDLSTFVLASLLTFLFIVPRLPVWLRYRFFYQKGIRTLF